MKEGDYVTLEKVKDLRFKGEHPNGINIGNTDIKGNVYDLPEIGQPFILGATEVQGHYLITSYTSRVVSWDKEQQLIETKNSVYKYTIRD